MIRIDVSRASLLAQIQQLIPNWLTLRDSQAERWSETKPVFLELQSFKCCYCQCEVNGRLNPSTNRRSTVGQDIEHYRPKNLVKPWKFPEGWPNPPRITEGPPAGYSWLRHHELNYAVSCKDCNTTFKANYFPILQPHQNYGAKPEPQELTVEKPLLIFPLGDLDDDPENIITFLGWDALPHSSLSSTDLAYWRAVACIEILNLNRQDLIGRRQARIAELGMLRGLSQNRASFDFATTTGAEFSACCRAYVRLCSDNPAEAKSLALKAWEGDRHNQEFLNEAWVL